MSLLVRVAERLGASARLSACRCMCTAPTNTRKDGSDPVLGPDDAYPAWVVELATDQMTLGEMEKKGYHNLTWEQQKRFHQLARREDIKVSNSLTAKK